MEKEKIMLDEKTRALMQNELAQIQAATQRANLMIRIYLNAIGKDGKYTLSNDGTYLINMDKDDGSGNSTQSE